MDSERKKLIIISLIIVIILIMTIALIFKLVLIEKDKNSNNIDENTNIETNEIQENQNEINEASNEASNIVEENKNTTNEYQNTQTSEKSTQIADPEQEIDKQSIQKQESNQEKALSIAKKDWGNNDSVYFSFEGINNDKYIIAVRDSNTTRAMRYYYIDIKQGTFTIEE